jgi:DNA-binding MarR family transcriptional regulator
MDNPRTKPFTNRGPILCTPRPALEMVPRTRIKQAEVFEAIPFFDILCRRGMPKPSRETLASLGRFSEAGFHILIALADAPKHGYAMMLDIEQMTGSRPGPGTLYTAIARLEERRWIEAMPSDDRRRPYRLTLAGRRVLRARVEAMRAMSRIAQTRLADS